MVRAFLVAVVVVVVSVLGGTLGYRLFLGLSWSNSFHHACLVLGEHPAAQHPDTASGNAFVGIYIMYARLVFLSVVAILVFPVVHRILHTLHLDEAPVRSNGRGNDGI